MRRLSLLVAVLLVLTGGAAFFLARAPSGPFPSAADLRAHGFAAWPVDTVAEAEEECADAEEWRLDAQATAVQFAQQVLRYPEPHAGEAFDDADHRVRLLIGSDGIEELFLGSVLELARYGRCWYVIEGIPREDYLEATLGFVFRGGRAHLLLADPLGLPHGFVGYGDWRTEIEDGVRQTVTWMPEIDRDATGHVILTAPDEDGVSEIVGARRLRPVPPPPTGSAAEPVPAEEVAGDSVWCNDTSRFNSPEAAIRDLYRGVFPRLLEQRRGFPHYERRRVRHVSGDSWRLVVDDVVLDATISQLGPKCYAIVSMTPRGRESPLDAVWLDDEGVTVEIGWGRADQALVDVAGVRGTLERTDERVTFPRGPLPAADPAIAEVVLFRKGHVVSAYRGLFARAEGQARDR